MPGKRWVSTAKTSRGADRQPQLDGHAPRFFIHDRQHTGQRQIREINTGIMVIPNQFLHDWLPRLKNSNAQKEYYLTDIVAMAVKDGIKVETTQPGHAWETLGINSKNQLAALERIVQNEPANKLLEQGVTLADPARIDIRGQLACGREVAIDINCIFEDRKSVV